MIELHTFAEAANCIEEGGAAYRFGNPYPIWYNGGKLYEYYQRQILSYANVGWAATHKIESPPLFSLDDQKAINWVLIPKEKWEEMEKKRKDDIEKLWIESRKRYETANTPVSITEKFSNEEYFQPKWWEKVLAYWNRRYD